MDKATALSITGGLSKPAKMPGMAYGLPAKECKVGSKLRAVAGSTCSGCYALKGQYVFRNVQQAQYRRLASITHPMWREAMAFLISNAPKSRRGYFRWHDSGDLQDVAHLLAIIDVCHMTPDVKHWLPTREKALVKSVLQMVPCPANLIVRFSDAMIDADASIDVGGVPTSGVHKAGPARGHACPAKAQYGNTCGPCRACWDRTVQHVSYPWH